MAIRTVNADNLNEFVSERQKANISNAEQVIAAVEKKTPIVETGGEQLNAPPDPGEAEPTAKAQAKKAKAGTEPGVQKRIDELTREKSELDEFAQGEYQARIDAQQKIKDLEAEVQRLKPVEKRQEELTEPDPTKYTDQALYDADRKKYLDAVVDRRVEAKLAAEREIERKAKQDALMQERVAVAKAEIPDFDAVIAAADRNKTPMPGHIQAAVLESDVGPQLAYYLAKDPGEQKRIFGLTPARALLELGKVETRFYKADTAAKTAPATPTIETTKAPAPISSIKTGDAQLNSDLTKPMNFADYKQQRMQEIRRKRH